MNDVRTLTAIALLGLVLWAAVLLVGVWVWRHVQ